MTHLIIAMITLVITTLTVLLTIAPIRFVITWVILYTIICSAIGIQNNTIMTVITNLLRVITTQTNIWVR